MSPRSTRAPYDAVFVDPARRGGRGRIFDPEAYSPPLSWAVDAARTAPRAALKIAPGIPHEAIPEDAEAEWISDGGDVKEAVLWFGTAPGRASGATLLPGPRTLLGRGLPDPGGPARSAATCTSRTAPSSARIWSPRSRSELRRRADRRDDRVRHGGRAAPDAVRHRVRDHRRAALQPEEAEGAAAGARGRRPHGQEARLGGRTGGAAPQGEAAGTERGDGVPDPGGGGADDADRAACVVPGTVGPRCVTAVLSACVVRLLSDRTEGEPWWITPISTSRTTT